MSTESPVPTRTALAIAAAACVMTLAVGTTVGSIFGYVGPRRQHSPSPDAPPSAPGRVVSEPRTASIVLVPVSPTSSPPGDTAKAPELRIAALRQGDFDELLDRGEHRRQEDHNDDD
jgi:hypothetical protein